MYIIILCIYTHTDYSDIKDGIIICIMTGHDAREGSDGTYLSDRGHPAAAAVAST